MSLKDCLSYRKGAAIMVNAERGDGEFRKCRVCSDELWGLDENMDFTINVGLRICFFLTQCKL